MNALGAPVGVLNVAMEDALAHAVTERERVLVLDAWLLLGVEYLARERGRGAARETLRALDVMVREARPTPDWPT